jgi:2-polyprenyl-6-methoxyphenol hydroxylase-like FAD-dependent oxidoreductase
MSTFVAECDAEAWVRSGLNRMTEDERTRFSEGIFAEELDGHSLLSNKSIWFSLPVTRCKHWFVGNRVLIGDALHSPHPSIGSGTLIAMEDAIGLASAVALHPTDVAAACAHYQRQHHAHANKLVQAAEKSFQWYEAIGEKLPRLDVVDLAFDYVTRTGRVNEQRLWAEYPAFMKAHEVRWNAWLAKHRAVPQPV